MSEDTFATDPIDYSEPLISDSVRLPVGIEIDGTRYRDVVIDEMTGVDDHNLASKKTGNNGAKGISMLICRCVQEVEGYLDKKKNPDKLFDRSFARKMTIVDREYLLSRIYMLGDMNDIVMAGQCPRCQSPWEEEAKISELEVVEWDEDKPLEVEFTLPRGLVVDGVTHRHGVMRFPTGREQELIGEITNPAQVFDAMFAACIVKLGELTSIDQEMLKRLTSRDRRYLTSYLQSAFPGVRQWKTVKCSCGRKFDIHADLTAFLDGSQKSGKG